MKLWLIRVIALLLALTLTGCELPSALEQALQQNTSVYPVTDEDLVAFPDMVYQRPQIAELEAYVDQTLATAQTGDVQATIDAFDVFYTAYDRFYTDIALADIYYCKDLTDTYWEEEYSYCMEVNPKVDELYERICYGLAASPIREDLEADDYFGEGFFDGYEGENLWDAEFSALLEQEAAILDRYFQLSQEGLDYQMGSYAYYEACGDELAQVLADLVALRQTISAYYGYDTYAEFAWDFYYYRDYTPSQTRDLLAQIRQELVPLYRQLDYTWWNGVSETYTQKQVMDYVRYVANNMGGMAQEAFQVMEHYQLYDTDYGVNKHNISFEVYLPSYTVPYLFVNASGTKYDCLTVTHEFGHFCNDYASYGSYAGIDVKEIFSQGMEYLSLCYTSPDQGMATAKMADSLCIYVEQAAYADFEMRIYDLPAQDISAQAIIDIYAQVMEDYGLVKGDPRYFVTIPHFYSYPMYVISYVVSNDAAMQIYQLELEEAGAGLAMMEENYDTQEAYFLAFLETAGLESPFVPGRMAQVSKTFSEILDR